jgi:AcrR family transcriptional regulator
MHTKSTAVKDKRVAQGDATRAALVVAARELFGEKGFADTGTDEIVMRAGVTKGALYHHFEGKEELFKAVFEQVQREVSDKAVAEFLGPDSWEALLKGCSLWDDVRAIENRFGAVALRGALRKAMHAGVLERQPLRPMALLLLGALSEGCLYIAEAEDPRAARTEIGSLIAEILSGFRVAPD